MISYLFLGLTLRFAVAFAIIVQGTNRAGAALKVLAAQYSSLTACALLVTMFCQPRIPNLKQTARTMTTVLFSVSQMHAVCAGYKNFEPTYET